MLELEDNRVQLQSLSEVGSSRGANKLGRSVEVKMIMIAYGIAVKRRRRKDRLSFFKLHVS
jgi:hypothetical protein